LTWTVTSPRSKEITSDYEKYSSPAPPQSPKADPSIGQVTPSYGRTMASTPPETHGLKWNVDGSSIGKPGPAGIGAGFSS